MPRSTATADDTATSLISPEEPQLRVVHAFEHIDPSVLMMEGVELPKPLREYHTKQVSTFFFQKSAGWLRWRDREGQTTSEHFNCNPQRDANGTRIYSLADIEILAHAFAEQSIIDAQHMEITLHLIRLIAIGYGVIL